MDVKFFKENALSHFENFAGDLLNEIRSNLRNETREITKDEEQKLITRLIQFTAYKDFSDLDINPFDDPYVGAMLLDENLQVLGVHRKHQRHEEHAEVNVILDTLDRIGSPTSADLLAKIKSAIDKKIWFDANKGKENFESLFIEAGNLIRTSLDANKLVLYSTLEPCRHYETQPSCSRIIASLKVDKVIYGADDTNAKGQGRYVLIDAGVPVDDNAAIDAALEINSLFYSGVFVYDAFFNNIDYSLASRPARHVYVNLKNPPFIKRFETIKGQRRLVLEPDKTGYKAKKIAPEYLSIAKSFTHDDMGQIDTSSLDETGVLFFSNISFEVVIKIIADFSRYSRYKIPKHLVFTKNPSADIGSNILLEKAFLVLKNIGCKFYFNSFQKKEEVFAARHHVLMSSMRDDLDDFFYLLVKISDPGDSSESSYQEFFGSGLDALKYLKEIEDSEKIISRVSIFFYEAQSNAVIRFLKSLNSERERNQNFIQKSNIVLECISRKSDALEPLKSEFHAKISGLLMVRSRIEGPKISSSHKAFEPINFSREVLDWDGDLKLFGKDTISDLARSFDWRSRRNAGQIFDSIVKSEPHYFEHVFIPRLSSLISGGISDDSWREICSYLNSFPELNSVFVKHYNEDLLKVLIELGTAFLKENISQKPWMQDIVWRWTAAWHHCSDYKFSDCFSEQHSFQLYNLVMSDFFLTTEYIHYCSINSRIPALEELTNLKSWENTSAEFTTTLATAAARSFMFNFPLKSNDILRDKFQSIFEAFSTKLRMDKEYFAEINRCNIVEKERAFSLHRSFHSELKKDEASKLICTFVAFKSFEIGVQNRTSSSLLSIGNLLSDLPTDLSGPCLQAICGDYDVSLRVASLNYIFSAKFKLESYSENVFEGDKVTKFMHRRMQKRLINKLISNNQHYWLEREVFSHLRKNKVASIYPSDLPEVLKKIIRSPREDEKVHPEVIREAEALNNTFKRILLVLPPINWPLVGGGDYCNKGSPPLGLGSLASKLSAEGHFVEIIDAHRFSYSMAEVVEVAKKFDFVGLSSVLSTVRATSQFINKLNSGTESNPVTIVGGQAVTLASRKSLSTWGINSTYLVVGPGETALTNIVNNHTDRFPVESVGVIHRDNYGESRIKERRNTSSLELKDWSEYPWIERDLFHDLNNGPYEPQTTRDLKHSEAHIVISRGCMWKCSFCTEAVILGTIKEVRRTVSDVLGEIRVLLSSEYNVDRIQFIDDNVFPSIGAPNLTKNQIDNGLVYCRTLLEGLTELRNVNQRGFGWRGLMRIEDFLTYKELLPNFIDLLSKSGCNLLAFGIESGDEEARKSMKGQKENISNSQMKDVFFALKAHDISSKGYFIIGGANESLESVEKTISFAKNSGLDLAYFAIYKNFRTIVKNRDKRDSKNAPEFKTFTFNLESLIHAKSDEWKLAFGQDYTENEVSNFKNTLKQLKSSGFEFKDLFKYNDFHGNEQDQQLLNDVSFQGDEERRVYFQLVRKAYLEFYGRKHWPKVYKKLIKSGY